MNLLLISSSYSGDEEYLEHCRATVKEFLDSCPPGHVLFAPYAEYDLDGYADTAQAFFTGLDPTVGGTFISLHRTPDPRRAIEAHDVKAIFIGGGNTFRLLKALQDNDLLDAIKQKVKHGAGYMGTSAGSNVACPTIMTTNDMPIVELGNFEAIGLVDFQINPHFVSGPLIEDHQGEPGKSESGSTMKKIRVL
ncbi:MAG TPA: dipeptidase PepE [Candidatus Limnocylindria bacterium]|nr:dipeptidase PepE [Candidatus Limnocylindria bacterium]